MALDVRDIAAAAVRSIRQLDTVTQNIAHANTPGFKAIHLSYELQSDPVSGSQDPGLEYKPYGRTDFSPGTLMRTGGALDIAIEGDGFLAVETRQGTAYIRGGSFHINRNNELVTSTGERVLGTSGPITIDGHDIQIGQDGTITVTETSGDGAVATNVGQLRVVTFDRPQNLKKQGDSQYVDPGNAGMQVMADPRVAGQSLEMSNVNAIKEMVNMIELQRTFETYQKVIRTMADQDKQATNQIGKVV
ncbi:MAG TPA: flagellar hook basal-body protein [Syntrophales bacterium]|jgi:flagellar basal body rod protein FlgG|nr:flagellar hook basal-body protein [Syntrophales bacterium]